jgi:hypothetical protein
MQSDDEILYSTHLHLMHHLHFHSYTPPLFLSKIHSILSQKSREKLSLFTTNKHHLKPPLNTTKLKEEITRKKLGSTPSSSSLVLLHHSL